MHAWFGLSFGIPDSRVAFLDPRQQLAARTRSGCINATTHPRKIGRQAAAQVCTRSEQPRPPQSACSCQANRRCCYIKEPVSCHLRRSMVT
jgi:hypothetical protein